MRLITIGHKAGGGGGDFCMLNIRMTQAVRDLNRDLENSTNSYPLRYTTKKKYYALQREERGKGGPCFITLSILVSGGGSL